MSDIQLFIFAAVALVTLLCLQKVRKESYGRVRQRQVDPHRLAGRSDRTHLSRMKAHEWANVAEADAITGALSRLGFVDAGAYVAGALPSLRLQFFLSQEESCYAVLHEHPKNGIWVNLVYRYADGSSAIFTSTRDRGLSHDPRHRLQHFPGAHPIELLEAARRTRPQLPLKSLRVAQIAAEFEAAWREQLEWRRLNPMTAREVLSVAETRNGTRLNTLPIASPQGLR